MLLLGSSDHVEIARGRRRSDVQLGMVQTLGKTSSSHRNGYFALTEDIHFERTWAVAVHIGEFQGGLRLIAEFCVVFGTHFCISMLFLDAEFDIFCIFAASKLREVVLSQTGTPKMPNKIYKELTL